LANATNWQRVEINIVSLIKADFAAGAVLISFGALLGKISFTQMLLLSVMEVFVYSLNEAVCNKLEITDVGGSMVIHVFGAFFGLSASYALTPAKAKGNKDNAAVYHSDMFSMVGTVFLWIYWPSFNAALATGNAQQRAVVNTVLSLTASCVFAFIFSQFWRKANHFNMVDIQNATLAGGVAAGAAADMVLHPAFALLIGAIAGTISVLGFSRVQRFVENKLGIHDTCGVLNLHGIPGILGAVVSMIASAAAVGRLYDPSQLYFVFPELENGRTAARQAQLQLAFLCITLGMAIIPGFFCGKVLTGCTFPKRFFVDVESWETPSREIPYFFDIRGEAKHSNDDTELPVAGPKHSSVDDKTLEKVMASFEAKINALEDELRDQKRNFRQQAKQSGNAPASAYPPSAIDGSLATILESLASKVNYLVDKSKKDE